MRRRRTRPVSRCWRACFEPAPRPVLPLRLALLPRSPLWSPHQLVWSPEPASASASQQRRSRRRLRCRRRRLRVRVPAPRWRPFVQHVPVLVPVWQSSCHSSNCATPPVWRDEVARSGNCLKPAAVPRLFLHEVASCAARSGAQCPGPPRQPRCRRLRAVRPEALQSPPFDGFAFYEWPCGQKKRRASAARRFSQFTFSLTSEDIGLSVPSELTAATEK